MSEPEWQNKLYFGDNLHILRDHVPDESVDLIYLDPPFNSRATYNVLFAEKNGSESFAQITAFEDTWHWGEEAENIYREVVKEGPKKLADLIQAMRTFLGQNDMMAYLVMMAPRLAELHRVLKPTGSIFLHCDPTASHYLKLMLDAIFDNRNFLNEIVWKRSSAHSDSSVCGRAHDILLLFSKEKKQLKWNSLYQAYDEEYVASHYRRKTEDGRIYRTDNLTAMGLSGGGYEYKWNGVVRIWRCPIEKMQQLHDEGRIHYTRNGVAEYIRYLDEMPGTPLQDIWTDIPAINSQARERLGYPTQKPEALLERIISASSNEDDLVLDPFCGCGTTINVAERLKRRWIGIDITHLAIALIKNRLQDTFGPELSTYDVIGDPKDLTSAQALAEHNRYQFEWWALSLVEARPAQDKKRGADSGIDGYINFFDDTSGQAKKIVVQVKSGSVTASQIRDLRAVVDRENAVIGAFITLKRPTKPMIKEALSAGYYAPEHLEKKHTAPKIQILTIDQILSGAQLQYPRILIGTFKRAQRQYKDKGPTQEQLF